MTDKRIKILLIEDNEDDALALSMCLTDIGADVTVAEDGLTGLNAIWATNPDLVLLDLKLPGLDGVGVLKELQKRGETIPVVITTGYKDRRKDVFEVGYNDLINIIYKPIEGETLELLVKFMAWRKRGDVGL